MTYTIELVDRDEKISTYYNITTDKTLKEVERVYEDAQREWYEDNNDFDCLIAHIEMRMEENGIKMEQLVPNLVLDF